MFKKGKTSRRVSYAKLITQAINSSPGKRMTVSDIYDWMVSNVDAFSDQSQFPSPNVWKNTIRYNLSAGSQFQRMKCNGMNKPSWWTVDVSKMKKRKYRKLKANVHNKTMSDSSFNNQIINNPPYHNNFTSMSMTTATNFQQPTLQFNCTNSQITASAVPLEQFSGCNIGNQKNVPPMCVNVNEVYPQQQFATINTNNIFHTEPHKMNSQYSTNGCRRSLAFFTISQSETCNIHTMEHAHNSSPSTKMKLCRFNEGITVNLQDDNNSFDHQTTERPANKLNISHDYYNDNITTPDTSCFQPKLLSEQLNNFEESSQMRRAQWASGDSQDTIVSTPVQLKYISRCENGCQADDLENHFPVDLSPLFFNTCNNQSEVNFNPSIEPQSSSTMVANDILKRCNSFPELFLDYNETCTVTSETSINDDLWFIEVEHCDD